MNSGEDRAGEGIMDETTTEESTADSATAEPSAPPAPEPKKRRTKINRIVVLLGFGLLAVIAFLIFQRIGRGKTNNAATRSSTSNVLAVSTATVRKGDTGVSVNSLA